jgi:hypothetical protein
MAQVLSGKVVGGVIVVEGEPLAEGTEVTVLLEDPNELPYELTPEDEAMLEAAEAEGGDVPASVVLAELGKRR